MRYLENRAVKFIRTALSSERSDPIFVAKKPNVQRHEKSGVKEPKEVSPQNGTAPQPENLVEHSPAVSKSGGDPETDSNSEKLADEAPLPQGELTVARRTRANPPPPKMSCWVAPSA